MSKLSAFTIVLSPRQPVEDTAISVAIAEVGLISIFDVGLEGVVIGKREPPVLDLPRKGILRHLGFGPDE